MDSRKKTGAAALAGAAVTGLIAFALFLAGGLLLWADHHYKDADGFLSTGSGHFSSPAYAITADDLRLHGGHDWFVSRDRYGTLRISASARQPVFVGVARTHDVERYLRGVAHSEVDDVELGPFTATYAMHAGTRAPGPPPPGGPGPPPRPPPPPPPAPPPPPPPRRPPATQHIWAAQAQGAGRQALTWNVQRGDWSIVVMNADGSRSVTAAVSAGAK